MESPVIFMLMAARHLPSALSRNCCLTRSITTRCAALPGLMPNSGAGAPQPASWKAFTVEYSAGSGDCRVASRSAMPLALRPTTSAMHCKSRKLPFADSHAWPRRVTPGIKKRIHVGQLSSATKPITETFRRIPDHIEYLRRTEPNARDLDHSGGRSTMRILNCKSPDPPRNLQLTA